MEQQISATFDACPGLRLVQGEDRAILVALRDRVTGSPIDLTGVVDVRFGFLALAGGNIRRRMAPLTVLASAVGPALPFTVPDHGFATGDAMVFASLGTLPAPLVALTTYLAVVVDANTFTLTTASGVAVAITGAPVGPFTIAVPDVSITSPPTSGLLTLLLAANVTAALQDGCAQSFQIELQADATHRRIIIENHMLDVFAQVTP